MTKKAKLDEVQRKLDDHEAVQMGIDEKEAKLDEVQRKLDDNEARQFVLYTGNAMIHMTRMIFANTNPTLSEDVSTHRLQQLATNVTNKQLSRA